MRIKEFLKNNIKVLVAFVIGIILATTGVYAATVISSSFVSYSNTSSKLTSTDVQSAIDELATKVDIRKRGNFISAYTYNSSTCVTGEEETCVKTECYKNKTAGSCPAGTIIKYKVNDTDIVTFHVMYDEGNTMTMQSQKNTINNTMWINEADYTTENTDDTSCSYYACSDEGPMTVLVALERATNSWTNVNNQTYTMGETVFKTNAYTGCDDDLSCTTNFYTLPSRTAKARMITVQEAYHLGCTNTDKSCPKWMYNYLALSTSYGGTVNDSSTDPETGSGSHAYWSMSAYTSTTDWAYLVNTSGCTGKNRAYITTVGARAVIEINKNS